MLTVISPCLSETGSWTPITSLHLPSMKTDWSHQPFHSEFFSFDLCLCSFIRIVCLLQGRAGFCAIYRNAGVRSDHTETSFFSTMFVWVEQSHTYIQQHFSLRGCHSTLRKLSLCCFIILPPIIFFKYWDKKNIPKKNQGKEWLLPGA